MRDLVAVIDRVTRGLALPGALGIAAILVHVTADVVLRYLFNSPIPATLEMVSRYYMIAIPELVKSGYRPGFACGAIAAGGTIGALIPPGILMIIYGVFAEISITQVFPGGISVGLLTALSYSLVILAISYFRPTSCRGGRSISAIQIPLQRSSPYGRYCCWGRWYLAACSAASSPPPRPAQSAPWARS